MTEQRMLSIYEISKATGESMDRVREMITNAVFKAFYDEKACEHVVPQSEVDAYLAKFGKKVAQKQVFKVAILDNEFRFANGIKLELSRDKRFEVKIAGYGIDGTALVKSFKPNMILINYIPKDTKVANFMEQLISLVAQIQPKVIVYTWASQQDIRASKVKKVGGSQAHDISRTCRNVVARVYSKLGVEK